jgi:hypothetical protein
MKVSSTPPAGIDGNMREWLHPKGREFQKHVAIFRSKFIFRPSYSLRVALLAQAESQGASSI